jgi:hypothetical protein
MVRLYAFSDMIFSNLYGLTIIREVLTEIEKKPTVLYASQILDVYEDI